MLGIAALAPLLLPACSARAQMPLDPALRAKLQAAGALEPVLTQLARARARGWFAPAPEQQGVDAASLEKRATWHALVLLVDFPDRPQSGSFGATAFQQRLFSVGTEPSGSLADFYLENSYGGLRITGDVVGWLRMPHPATWYCNTDGQAGTADDYGLGAWPQNAQGLAADAVAAADPLVDFQLYRNGRAKVDGVFVVHAGEGAEQSGAAGDFWSHEYFLDVATADGVQVGRYTMEPELRTGQQLTDIGVFAHEFGHALGGFPDLYDLDRSSGGVGRWSLMGTGVWNGAGHSPAHYDAWCKARLGFVAPLELQAPQQDVTLPAVEQQPTVIRLHRPTHAAGEYLLLEHRRWTGFDRQLPGQGLLVWHVDEAQTHNRNETCGPAPAHPLVRLLQADGGCELEAGDTGDAGDPFPGASGNVQLGGSTLPDTRAYSGVATQLVLDDIAPVAGAIRLDVRFSEPGMTRVPDDQPTVAAALAVATAGDVIRIRAGHLAVGQFAVPAGVTVSGGWDAAFVAQDAANPSVLQAATGAPVVLVGAGADTVRLDHLVVRAGTGAQVSLPTSRWVGGGLLVQGGRVRATQCRFEDNAAGPAAAQPTRGGAVAGLGATLVLEDCSFSGSRAIEGLDVYAEAGDVTLRRCTFAGGAADAAAAGSPQRGGALLALDAATVQVEQCSIAGYTGLQHGAGIYATATAMVLVRGSSIHDCACMAGGAGLYVRAPSLRVEDSELFGNVAGQFGGGAHVDGGQLIWTGGRLEANRAQYGAGLTAQSLGVGSTVSGVLLLENIAAHAGGGIALNGGVATVEHCVFHADVASYAGSALYANAAGATVRNSVFLDNRSAPAITRSIGPSLALMHNVFWENDAVPPVAGAQWGSTDREVPPGFVDPANRDYHLSAGSALIDAGDPAGAPDFDGSRADIGAFGGWFDPGGRPAAPLGTFVVPQGADARVVWSLSGSGTQQTGAVVYGLTDPAATPGPGDILGLVQGPVTLWIHAAAPPGITYRVQSIDAQAHAGGLGAPVSLGQTSAPDLAARGALRVGAVTPNPFNPSATVALELPWAGRLTAQVADAAGRRVRVLHEGPAGPGPIVLRWDGRDGRGAAAASGVYLLRVELDGAPSGRAAAAVRRMVLVR